MQAVFPEGKASRLEAQHASSKGRFWKNHYWLWVAGAILIVTLGFMWLSWKSIQDMETKKCQEFENLASSIGEIARTNILSQQFDAYSENLNIIKQTAYIDYILVTLKNRVVLQSGDPSQVSRHNHLVKQALSLQDNKQAEMTISFSLEEFYQSKQRIIRAFAVISTLLVLLGWVGFSLYRTHRQLNITHEHLLQAEKTKEDMIYSITHDAKQDLQVIQGKLSALIPKVKESMKNEKIERDMKLVQASADSINRFLNNLKDQQGLIKGKIEVLPENILLSPLVISVAEAFMEKLHVRNMQVEIKQMEKTTTVWVDPQVVKRVVMNLIHNAMKYSPQGGTICLWQEIQGQEIVTYVRDQGQGIPEKDWQRIFEAYVQLDTKKEGMGLGLATARKLIELMQGRLGVQDSVVGQGTTMYFALPISQQYKQVK